MFSFSVFLIYLIYIIPNKFLIFDNFLINFAKLKSSILDSLPYLYRIFLAIFILITLVLILILILGGISRIIKIIKIKSKQISFK